MITNELGYDFHKIRMARINKQNLTVAYLVLVLFPTFFILFLVFLTLYLTKTPMEFNGTIRYFEDSEYKRFFLVFLTVMAAVSFMNVVIFLFVVKNGRKYPIYFNLDADNNPVVYAIERKRHVYVDNNRIIILNPLNSSLTRYEDKIQAQRALESYVFWLQLDRIPKIKIRNYQNKIKIRFSDDLLSPAEFRNYTLKLDSSGALVSYRESIVSKRYGNQQMNANNLYILEDVNRNFRIPYHPAILSETIAN